MTEQKSRGRPKDLEKRAAILRAAHRLFFERGISPVTIEDEALIHGVRYFVELVHQRLLQAA